MTQGYREAPPVELELTDEEIEFWDRAACAALSNSAGGTSAITWVAKYADALVKERRARFGVRGSNG